MSVTFQVDFAHEERSLDSLRDPNRIAHAALFGMTTARPNSTWRKNEPHRNLRTARA